MTTHQKKSPHQPVRQQNAAANLACIHQPYRTAMDFAHMKQDNLYPFNTCVSLRVNCLFERHQVEKNLNLLQARHFKLNARLSPCDPAGNITWVPQTGLKIEVRQTFDLDALALQRCIQEETERPFEAGFALLRLVLVNDSVSNAQDILFVHSHAIMDGFSLLGLINDLLRLLDAERQTTPHLSSQLHPQSMYPALLPQEGLEHELEAPKAMFELGQPVPQYTAKKTAPNIYIPFAQRRTRFAHIQLSLEQSDRLLKACKVQGVRIFHALSAASLLLQQQKIHYLNHQSGRTDILCKLIMSLRDGFDPPIADSVMGNFISIALFSMHLNSSEALWPLAKTFKAKVKAILEEKKIAALPFEQMDLKTYERAADLEQPLCQWSNLGIIDHHFSGYRTFQVVDFLLVCNSREDSNPSSVRGIFYTFHGRMKASLWCVEPFLNAWEGQQMLNQVFELLLKHAISMTEKSNA